MNVGCQPAEGLISSMDERRRLPSLPRGSLTMHPTRFMLLGPLGLLLACGDSASTGTTTSPPPRDDTPFEYSLLFTPSDPTFGTGGMVRGVGAIWRWSTAGAFVLELPVAPVSGTPFGGTGLVLTLTDPSPPPAWRRNRAASPTREATRNAVRRSGRASRPVVRARSRRTGPLRH